MNWITKHFKYWALKRAIKKRPPTPLTLGDHNDCYVIYLRVPSNYKIGDEAAFANSVLIDDFKKNSFSGRGLVGENYQRPVKIDKKQSERWNIYIRRYFGWIVVEYQSISEFWWGECSLLPQRLFLLEKIRQDLFNRKTSFRHDRIKLLRDIAELHFSQPRNGNPFLPPKAWDRVSLLSKLYGNRVHLHPKKDEIQTKFNFLLEALAESSDLKKDARKHFEITGKALNSLAEYELSERRHNDSRNLSVIVALLTLIIASATAVQAYVAWSNRPRIDITQAPVPSAAVQTSQSLSRSPTQPKTAP